MAGFTGRNGSIHPHCPQGALTIDREVRHMTASELVHAAWRKSSYSGHANSNCVEVASAGHTVAVRDSKNPRDGQLTFAAGDWREFIRGVKEGRFDLC
jgi:Domain of unknown function (DUF397)